MKEIWKDIPDYEGFYQASNQGRLKSLDRIVIGNRKRYGKINKLENNHKGYLRANLNKNGERERIFIHRIVAMLFIENPENKPFINHIDENPSNNHYKNLEWCTAKENANHGTSTARQSAKLKNIGGSIKAKKVYQYDKNLNLVKIFPSAMEAHRQGFTQANISKVCNGERPHHKGFIWSHRKLKKT